MKKVLVLLVSALLLAAAVPAMAAYFDSGKVPGYDWLEYERFRVHDDGTVTVTMENHSNRFASILAKVFFIDRGGNVIGYTWVDADIVENGESISQSWVYGCPPTKAKTASDIRWQVSYVN